MMQKNGSFQTNVFINCPFDTTYTPFLQALLFTVIDSGLEPRIASERSDSGEIRVDKIKTLIKESRYSIHDISRMEPLGQRDLPRFNMPFELGLDLGCRAFGTEHLCKKKCLILEKRKYRYRTVLSDISGNDIRAHNNNVEKLARHVRNWIYENINSQVQAATRIWQRYNEFYAYFERTLKEFGFTKKDITEMPVREFIDYVKSWRVSSQGS